MEGSQFPHLTLLTPEVGGFSLLLVRGEGFSGVHMVSMDTAMEAKVPTHPRPLLIVPHWDGERASYYCKVRMQVQSPLVVHQHHRSGGAHYHLTGRKVLAFCLAFSDMTLVGCWSTPSVSSGVGSLNSPLSLCWWGWGMESRFFCGIWLESGC